MATLNFGPEADKVRKNLKPYGILSYRTWEEGSMDVALNGYLLEPYQMGEKEHWRPLLLSILGTKAATERFVHLHEAVSILLPYPQCEGIDKRKGWIAEPWLRDNPQLLPGALKFEARRIEGTIWWQTVVYRKDLLETGLDQAGILRAYLIGVDAADADMGFPRFLKESGIPFLPEWLDLLTAEIKKRSSWTTRLVGHQMTGWALRIPRMDLLTLIQDLAREGKLLLPATLT